MRAVPSNITSKEPTSDKKQQIIHAEANQAYLANLNARYFLQSGLAQKEVVAATGACVGLQMPKQHNQAAQK